MAVARRINASSGGFLQFPVGYRPLSNEEGVDGWLSPPLNRIPNMANSSSRWSNESYPEVMALAIKVLASQFPPHKMPSAASFSAWLSSESKPPETAVASKELAPRADLQADCASAIITSSGNSA